MEYVCDIFFVKMAYSVWCKPTPYTITPYTVGHFDNKYFTLFTAVGQVKILASLHISYISLVSGAKSLFGFRVLQISHTKAFLLHDPLQKKNIQYIYTRILGWTPDNTVTEWMGDTGIPSDSLFDEICVEFFLSPQKRWTFGNTKLQLQIQLQLQLFFKL